MNIEIYSLPNCKYCIEAKSLLKSKNLEYISHEINSLEDRENIKQKFPNARTAPIILINDIHIGGYTQLQEYLNDKNI